MTEHAVIHVLGVEGFRCVRQEDDGEFQPLALVDGHDAHGVRGDGGAVRFELLIVFRKLGEVIEEGVEAIVAAAVSLQRQLVEGLDVRLAEAAAGKAGHIGEVAGVVQNVSDERRHAVLDAAAAPHVEMGKEAGHLLCFFGGEDRRRFGKDLEEMGKAPVFLGQVEIGYVGLCKSHEEGA